MTPGADRAGAMGRRLDRTARRLGMTPEGRTLLGRAFRAAMEPRRAAIEDDHHPDYLHPARTALILMDDARVADPTVLAAALLAETRDRGLAVSDRVVERISTAARRILDPLPLPEREGDRLLESLLSMPTASALVAVAERLDHARHLHLRDRAEWAEYHSVTRDAYAPVAVRTQPALGERLAWWCETFQRRFLEG